MSHSLRAKLSGLRYKGILEDKDYKRLCHALDLEKAEQEPCDDVVSRQWLMRKATERFYTTNYFNHITKMIEEAPPVRPQEQTGHWIFDEILDKHYYCSECMSMGVDYWDYCPYCGAEMVEPQERSDKE